MASDLYAILGVHRSASAVEIKAAYRTMSKKVHPDNADGLGSASAFAVLSNAYAVLRDPDRRKAYDDSGKIEPPEDRRADALNIVNMMMEVALGQVGDGAITNDVVAALRAGADKRIGEIEADIQGMRRLIVRLAGFASRFSSKTETNHLGRMVEDRIQRIEGSIKAALDSVELHKVAAEIIGEHSFQFDVPQPSPPFATWGGICTSLGR